MNNKGLLSAQINKKDEFFTPYDLIQQELEKYDLTDKTVYCNCDSYKSQFFTYFYNNFFKLKLKKLIVTGLNEKKLVIDRGILDCYKLEGNGDFRSEECVELLKESDVVITNPPFSLFREFLKLLVENNKQFLILGNINCITCNDIAPLIRERKMWLGHSIHSGDRKFFVPDDYPMDAATCGEENGALFISVKGIRWFTNMEHGVKPEKLVLTKHYTPEEFPMFDKYLVINVDKTSDIPCDWLGPMGVPITFLDKWDPTEFTILDANDFRKTKNVPRRKHGLIKSSEATINGNPIYARLVIQKIQ